jgi:anaerobic magnesium-protoporphyrin IX monomethyl ester cyclase
VIGKRSGKKLAAMGITRISTIRNMNQSESMKIKLLLVRMDTRKGQVVHVVTDPPLGIMSLSAVVKLELGESVEVRIRDMRLKHQRRAFRRELLEWRPDIVGFSSLSMESERTADWARLVKEVLPQATVIVGGPYASSTPLECLEDTGADTAFRGEAESSLCEWLRCHMNGESVADVAGLALRDENGRPFLTPARSEFEDISALPMPDWEAIEIEDYFSGYSMNLFNAHRRYATIITSRGCPYQCVYCHHFFGNKVRFRELSLVMEEIRFLYDKYGIRELQICDDIFNIDRKRVLEFCRMLKESGMHLYLTFPNALRGDLLTEEVIDALKDAGAYMIVFSIESGSARIQKLINKNLNLEKVIRMIRYADSRGIITKSAFMIGFVTETREEIQQTIDLAMSLPLLHGSFLTVAPYENTELCSITRKHDPGFDPGKNAQFIGYSPSYTEKMGYDLPKIQRWAYTRFYFCSARLPRILWRFPRPFHFLRCFFSEGIRVFFGTK